MNEPLDFDPTIYKLEDEVLEILEAAGVDSKTYDKVVELVHNKVEKLQELIIDLSFVCECNDWKHGDEDSLLARIQEM